MKKSSPIIGITSVEDWDKKWPDIFDHYQHDLRHGYYINAFISDVGARVLEIGAGSFRDMALLNTLGVDCDGTDFSQTAVELSRQLFPYLKNKIFQSDAFDFKLLKDNSYDITFHNGFWALFNEDSDLIKLLHQQARISKKLVIATVHNAHNKTFFDYFKKLSVNDALYRIRFFEVEEMRDLMLNVCRHVDIVPVGKGKKLYEDELINRGENGREVLRSFFDQAKMAHLNISERLLCIGYL